MPFSTVVVGGGAAGIAAARRLHDAGAGVLLLEARGRLGGRAWTEAAADGTSIDLGCGWLHSADRNPWTAIAATRGFDIDRTPPPWMSRRQPRDDMRDDTAGLRELMRYRELLDGYPQDARDRPASELLPEGGAWNGLLNAVSTFYSGVELDRLSTVDYARFDDSGVNLRLPRGYGALVAAEAAGLPVRLNSRVRQIDHRGKAIRIVTQDGSSLDCGAVIVTLPSAIIAQEPDLFLPALPGKAEAAAGLPLGLADKLFLALEEADRFHPESRVFGRTDRAGTAAYHFRPFGRAQIECYFGGACADALELEGNDGFFAFARDELAAIFGSDFARLIKPLALHRWRADPLARGSYSYALPGHADDRATLAEPVDGRIFLAGEACSTHDFSTAHGAYRTGVAAADDVLNHWKRGV
jgi:monoamine oxidase